MDGPQPRPRGLLARADRPLARDRAVVAGAVVHLGAREDDVRLLQQPLRGPQPRERPRAPAPPAADARRARPARRADEPLLSRRLGLFALFALVVGAACVRLGFWQLSR